MKYKRPAPSHRMVWYIDTEYIYAMTHSRYGVRKLQPIQTPRNEMLYCRSYSKKANRVFKTLEEAEDNIRLRQKQYDIRKELEEELKKRMEEQE